MRMAGTAAHNGKAAPNQEQRHARTTHKNKEYCLWAGGRSGAAESHFPRLPLHLKSGFCCSCKSYAQLCLKNMVRCRGVPNPKVKEGGSDDGHGCWYNRYRHLCLCLPPLPPASPKTRQLLILSLLFAPPPLPSPPPQPAVFFTGRAAPVRVHLFHCRSSRGLNELKETSGWHGNLHRRKSISRDRARGSPLSASWRFAGSVRFCHRSPAVHRALNT